MNKSKQTVAAVTCTQFFIQIKITLIKDIRPANYMGCYFNTLWCLSEDT